MYEIYDYDAQRVVKEGVDLQTLIASAKRRKHQVVVRIKYANYNLYRNERRQNNANSVINAN